MHLLERYALALASKIDRPFIIPKYFPLNINKYITVHFATKNAKTFDYGQEVIDIIKPELDKLGITIVQIGAQNEQPLNGCYLTQGQTTINQVAYIIKNSLLHFGSDSFPVHFAGYYDIPIVALYSTNYIGCVKPYWGDKNKQILLEPDRDKSGFLPSFSYEENPKTINTINSETIANHIFKLLKIDYQYKYNTLYIGENYHHKLLEMIPDHIIELNQFGVDNIIVRMDYLFDESILAEQLKRGKCSIVTNKSLNQNILIKYKHNIKEIVYFIEKDNDPKFIELIQKIGIKFILISFLPEEEVNKLKLHYMDYNLIIQKKLQKPDILKNLDLTKIYYKSGKITLSQGKFYSSLAGYKNKIEMGPNKMNQLIDDPDLYKDLEYIYLLEKLD
jgi:hypothetical protein